MLMKYKNAYIFGDCMLTGAAKVISLLYHSHSSSLVKYSKFNFCIDLMLVFIEMTLISASAKH